MHRFNMCEMLRLALLLICLIYIARTHAEDANEASAPASEDRSLLSSDVGAGRTFGHIKRFQAALLPIMFKLGVLSAVIIMTLILAAKGVLIGKLLLLLNLTFFAIKFGSFLKLDHHHQHHQGVAWQAPVINHGSGWAPHKDVHLHIHNAQPAKPDYTIPYSTIDTHGWQSNTVDNSAWNTNTYGNSGRQLTNDVDLTYGGGSYAASSPTISSFAPKVIGKREDKVHIVQSIQPIRNYNDDNVQHVQTLHSKMLGKRENLGPTIVMAQSLPYVSPYSYLSHSPRK